jgi:putative transposase
LPAAIVAQPRSHPRRSRTDTNQDTPSQVRCVEPLIRDRAGQFTTSFDAVLTGAGIEIVNIPPRCPRANCFAERFVLTARTELTDRILIFGERHLRTVLAQYRAHYNGRRPHRALSLVPPRPAHPAPDLEQQRIRRRPILAGLINEYERAA